MYRENVVGTVIVFACLRFLDQIKDIAFTMSLAPKEIQGLRLRQLGTPRMIEAEKKDPRARSSLSGSQVQTSQGSPGPNYCFSY